MVVLDQRVKGRLAIARAHSKNGEFPGEGHKALEDERDLGKFRFGL